MKSLLAGVLLTLGISPMALAEDAPTPPDPSLVSIIDQRDPRFQMSVEHLSRVVGLIEKARYEAIASARMKALPGFDYASLHSDLNRMQAELSKILLPEERRLKYQKLVPDSVYLVPRSSTAQE